ncbi:MAG: hypothetical protein ACQETO_08745 [Pseudomonadota bacterium]
MRRYVVLTGVLMVLIAGGVPTLNGWWLRHRISTGLAGLPRTPDLLVEQVSSQGGWLDSSLTLRLRGKAVDGSAEGIPLILHVSHGPLIWHLPDTPWRLAHLQLGTPREYHGPGANRYSGAAVVRLAPGGELGIRGILGAEIFDGDHQAHFSASWPLSSWWGNDHGIRSATTANMYLELDADALLTSPAAETLRVYEQQGWTRINRGRALTDLQLHHGILTINGQQLTMDSLLASQ